MTSAEEFTKVYDMCVDKTLTTTSTDEGLNWEQSVHVHDIVDISKKLQSFHQTNPDSINVLQDRLQQVVSAGNDSLSMCHQREQQRAMLH